MPTMTTTFWQNAIIFLKSGHFPLKWQEHTNTNQFTYRFPRSYENYLNESKWEIAAGASCSSLRVDISINQSHANFPQKHQNSQVDPAFQFIRLQIKIPCLSFYSQGSILDTPCFRQCLLFYCKAATLQIISNFLLPWSASGFCVSWLPRSFASTSML